MKNVMIVGAGISGLTAGIYALQSGFNVTIYESHNIPGGASTSWKRKEYLFEGGMHWLTGSSEKVPLNRLWHELGALDESVVIHNREIFLETDYNGQAAYLYRDIDKLRRHFLEISPEDKKEINKLCSDIKKFTKVYMPIMDIKGVKVKQKVKNHLSMLFKMLPAFPKMGYYTKQTVKEYAEKYKSPILKLLIRNIIGDDYSAIGMVFTIATLASGDGGYPEGGSLNMAKRMATRFEALGGKINYGTPVSKVWVENGIAKGLFVNGEYLQSDAVIVSQDTLVAIDNLFDSPIHEPWAEKMRKNTKPLLNTFISVGVETDLTGFNERIEFTSEKPLICAGKKESVIGICNYASYKGYAPEGCTAITSAIMGDSYDYWKTCKENGTYQMEKEKLAKDFIEILAEKFPQTAGKVAVWDIATPLTYERYLGSYKGSWMSVMGKGSMAEYYPTKPESIQNVYFAGQRLRSPGGLPVAVDSGRKAVQYLCIDTDTVFQGNI